MSYLVDVPGGPCSFLSRDRGSWRGRGIESWEGKGGQLQTGYNIWEIKKERNELSERSDTDISVFHVTGESKKKSGNFIPDIRNRKASEIKQKLEVETQGKWGELVGKLSATKPRNGWFMRHTVKSFQLYYNFDSFYN